MEMHIFEIATELLDRFIQSSRQLNTLCDTESLQIRLLTEHSLVELLLKGVDCGGAPVRGSRFRTLSRPH